MPHIDLPEGVPGIRSAMQFRPSDPRVYGERAHLVVEQGYVGSVPASG